MSRQRENLVNECPPNRGHSNVYGARRCLPRNKGDGHYPAARRRHRPCSASLLFDRIRSSCGFPPGFVAFKGRGPNWSYGASMQARPLDGAVLTQRPSRFGLAQAAGQGQAGLLRSMPRGNEPRDRDRLPVARRAPCPDFACPAQPNARRIVVAGQPAQDSEGHRPVEGDPPLHVGSVRDDFLPDVIGRAIFLRPFADGGIALSRSRTKSATHRIAMPRN